MYAVIMAGGEGTRFWPLSRKNLPKQFLKIFGKHTLIEETFLRIKPLIKEENILLVINQAHLKLTRKIFKNKRVKILAEPFGRNTAPCLGLAALYILDRSGDVPFMALPADHFIANNKNFLSALKNAFDAIKNGGIAAIGINPTHPETGYGYIKKDKPISANKNYKIFKVKKFIEKPNLKEAGHFIQSGNYLWNSGIFILKPQMLLDEIKLHLPEIYKNLIEIKKVNFNPKKIKQFYQLMPAISLDYGIIEKTTQPIYVLTGNFSWSDLGSWEALYHLRANKKDSAGNLVKGDALLIDSCNNFVKIPSKKLMAGLGLNNTLIIDTPDILLVIPLNRSQEIKKINETLKTKSLKKWL
ncbi:MAG: mannose-1-phosphate guanylyltransferase [Armatimonadetes bacterium]|nr:mannose-1-phosphate guanylyltransferase [Armatimonadota bacterium]